MSKEIKGYILVNNKSQFLRTGTTLSHGGDKTSYHWFDEINSAEIFIHESTVLDHLKNAPGAAGILPALETRTVTIREFKAQ